MHERPGMSISHKPLNEQVIVMTGASTGIGLATAELAAERGAAVVLVGRSEIELAIATARIRQRGGCVAGVAADVADQRHVAQIGIAAMSEFGRIDTWVNSAGLGICGPLRDQPPAGVRKLFDANFWSVVYGCNVAVEHMRSTGGTIVNVGGAMSDRGAPLLGVSGAAKLAVRGYTDALRREVEHHDLPIRVSLVETLDPPLVEQAPNGDNGRHDGPAACRPEDVAQAILACAEKPVPEIAVDVPRLRLAIATLAPRLTDVMMERQVQNQTKRDAVTTYTRAALADVSRALPLVALGAIVAAGVAASRRP